MGTSHDFDGTAPAMPHHTVLEIGQKSHDRRKAAPRRCSPYEHRRPGVPIESLGVAAAATAPARTGGGGPGSTRPLRAALVLERTHGPKVELGLVPARGGRGRWPVLVAPNEAGVPRDLAATGAQGPVQVWDNVKGHGFRFHGVGKKGELPAGSFDGDSEHTPWP